MGKLWRRILFLVNRRKLERELSDEMSAHREMMSADRRSHFGNATRLQEDSRELWAWPWLGQLRQDLIYGVRVLFKSPGFTLGAIAVLALGVGVNIAEFQIFDALMFHRLEVRAPDSILQLTRVSRQGRRLGFPHGAFEFYQAQTHSLAWLVAEDSTLDVTVEGTTDIRSTLVSPNYFASLGLLPAYGRLLDQQDAKPGAVAVVDFGYDYWRTQWGADPNVVGRIVHINNQPVQVVGILPYTFPRGLLGRRSEVWFPLEMRSLLSRGIPPVHGDFSRPAEALFGALKPGVSQTAGEAEFTALTHELAGLQPIYFQTAERINELPVQDSVLSGIRRQPGIAIFFVMILLILFSACANLGNMLLARGMAREREIDIRMAIGASRARVVRQLMTENLLLALFGAAAGVAFGAIAVRLLLNALQLQFTLHVTIGWPIFVAALVLTMFSAIAFGLPSALQTVRVHSRKVHLRQSLIGVQVAVSCLLLIASSVLAHNAIGSSSIDLAFDYRNMAVVYPQLYGRNLPPQIVKEKLDALTTRIASLPGVEGVTTATVPPLGTRGSVETLPGLPHVFRNAIAPNYFTVMHLPVVRGRIFQPAETDVVIVSESATRAVWPNQDPLGKIWTLAGAKRTVVGVVKDSGANLIADAESIEAYLPLENTQGGAALIVHSHGEMGQLARDISASAATMDETVSISLMAASRENVLDVYRRLITVIGSISFVASVLAAAGMFALVAFAVAQRTRELGIRIAIGAGPSHILDVLLRQNIKPTVFGCLAGMILAWVLGKLVRNQLPLHDHDPIDIIGFVAGLASFALIALLATLAPALRALRINPSATLRED